MSSPKKPQAAAHGPQWQPELPSPLPGPMDPAVLAVRFAAELGRVVGLLPPVHIAIVRREQLVFSALAVFRQLAAAPIPPQVVFASGPSRSADIENDLSIGVHGPGQVHVILCD